MSNNNFALSEAQSVSVFVHHLLNEPLDTQLDMKGQGPENGSSLNDVVRHSCSIGFTGKGISDIHT